VAGLQGFVHRQGSLESGDYGDYHQIGTVDTIIPGTHTQRVVRPVSLLVTLMRLYREHQDRGLTLRSQGQANTQGL